MATNGKDCKHEELYIGIKGDVFCFICAEEIAEDDYVIRTKPQVKLMQDVIEAGEKATSHIPKKGRKEFKCSHCNKNTPLLLDGIIGHLSALQKALDAYRKDE